MLKILQKTLGVIAAALGGYVLLFQNYEIMPYMMFSSGSMMLVMGLSEIKEERKQMGVISIVASLFLFFVSIYVLLN